MSTSGDVLGEKETVIELLLPGLHLRRAANAGLVGIRAEQCPATKGRERTQLSLLQTT
jgi:hypothetical protein